MAPYKVKYANLVFEKQKISNGVPEHVGLKMKKQCNAIYNYFLFAREVILLHSTSGERSEPQVLCKSITSQAKR